MKKYLFVLIVIISVASCRNPNTEAEQHLINVHKTVEPVYSYLNYCIASIRAISEEDQIELNDLRIIEIRKISIIIDSLQQICDTALLKLAQIEPYDGNDVLISHFANTIEVFKKDLIKSLKEFITYWNDDNVNYLLEKTIEESLMLITTNEIIRFEVLKEYKKDYHLKPERIKLWSKKRKSKLMLAFLERNSHEASCIEGDCINGFGKSIDFSGSEYKGYFKDGLFHGEGALKYSDGETYVGEFKMGKFDGYGEYKWKDGNLYKGDWKNDDFNGFGTMIWADGDSTIGIWENGKIINEDLR